MNNLPLITIVTATTGTAYLKKNLNSVESQTYPNIQHLVVADGPKVKIPFSKRRDFIQLPYPTGKEGYNGHRIYAAATYLAKGDFIMYLDEDNWLQPDHVQSLMDNVKPNAWGYSMRKIYTMDGKFVCFDDCESLGPEYKSIINDFFVDVNCYLFPRVLALQLSPLWFRRARHSGEQPEVDRLLIKILMENNVPYFTNKLYTVNYRAGNRSDSVQPEFFVNGNRMMEQTYGGKLPWQTGMESGKVKTHGQTENTTGLLYV